MTLTHALLYEALKQPAFIVDSEIALLQECAAKSRSLVEIGCAWGGSTVCLLIAMSKNAHLTSVDNFTQDSMDNWRASEGECIEAVYRALHALGHDREVNWKLLARESVTVAQAWTSGIDALFLDGDHSWQGVSSDFLNWTPFLKRGGLLMLHDSCRDDDAPDEGFHHGWPAPTALAEQLRHDDMWKLYGAAFSLTVFEKVA